MARLYDNRVADHPGRDLTALEREQNTYRRDLQRLLAEGEAGRSP